MTTASTSHSDRIVVIVDDSPEDTAFMKATLAGNGYRTTEFSDESSFLAALDRLPSGCVLLDLRFKKQSGVEEPSGLETLKALRKRRSDLAVIMISGMGDIPSAVQAMQSGACDFIEKNRLKTDLLGSVSRALARDSEAVPASVAKQRAAEIRQHLTPRESEILDLLLQGYRNKQVAYELKVSARTVEAHRANMMRRVGASSFAELIGLVLGNARIER
jgi:two-component system response regulator FixJ